MKAMMKMIKKITSLLLASCLCILAGLNCYAEEAATYLTSEDALRAYGMPESEIEALDPDIRDFIAEDLACQGNPDQIEYVESNVVDMPVAYVNQYLSNISFYASAFKTGNTISIYPTYEFTGNKRPRGNDSFCVAIGDAMTPYQYSGKVWYKDEYYSNQWLEFGAMNTTNQGFYYGEYSGAQLGNPAWDIKFKGCASIKAQAGSGSSKQLIMSYMYNPNSVDYTLGVSVGPVSVGYNSSGTIYSAAQSVILNY